MKKLRMGFFERIFGVYPYLFVISYRLNSGAWPESFDFDTTKAIALVSLVTSIVTIIATNYVLRLSHIHYQLNTIFNLLTVFFWMYFHYFILIKRRIGINFNKKYDKLHKTEKILLAFYLVLIFLLIGWLSAAARAPL